MRGGNATVSVTAGRETIHGLMIPPGVTLRGRVLDPREVPIGDATVYLSNYGNTGQGAPLTM